MELVAGKLLLCGFIGADRDRWRSASRRLSQAAFPVPKSEGPGHLQWRWGVLAGSGAPAKHCIYSIIDMFFSPIALRLDKDCVASSELRRGCGRPFHKRAVPQDGFPSEVVSYLM